MKNIPYLLTVLVIFTTGCYPTAPKKIASPLQEQKIASTETGMLPETPPTSTPQSIPLPVTLGPDEFPPGYNPLSGQPVADPSLLKTPAVLVSISHFPSIARPQSGLSFAPFVYEYFITEGSTRHLAVFYGEFPEPEIALHGDCEIRKEPVIQTKNILGDHVWHDMNQNGIQDPGEDGIGGICINLYDAENNLIQKTTTDSNGYYAFNVEPGQYVIEFTKVPWFDFTQKNIGGEIQDSDADQTSGRTDAFDVTSPLHYVDAGLIPIPNKIPADISSAQLPLAQVGPVRSGRLLYQHIGGYFQNSCLIYASADPQVLAEIPGCATVPHTDSGGGAMLELTRMKEIARQNSVGNTNFNYTSNLFSDEKPQGGEPVLELYEYWAYLNQSKWVYDAASRAWWRHVDNSNPASPGILHPEIDRLNGRQLMFENIIVLFADHKVVTPTIVDMNLSQGELGKAVLFRDGLMFNIRWSTRATDYEKKTGLRRPIQFQTLDGLPIALRPGHTWVMIVTPQSYLEELSANIWKARFFAPAGAK